MLSLGAPIALNTDETLLLHFLHVSNFADVSVGLSDGLPSEVVGFLVLSAVSS